MDRSPMKARQWRLSSGDSPVETRRWRRSGGSFTYPICDHAADIYIRRFFSIHHIRWQRQSKNASKDLLAYVLLINHLGIANAELPSVSIVVDKHYPKSS